MLEFRVGEPIQLQSQVQLNEWGLKHIKKQKKMGIIKNNIERFRH